MDDVEAKVPYQPTEKRRFELSHDEYSRERIRGLLKAESTLRTEVPFFAGMTLFGSLSKGKELTEETALLTDIDAIAFIDTDKYADTISRFVTDNEGFRRYFNEEYMKNPLVLTQDAVRFRSENTERAARIYIAKRVQEIVHNETLLQPIDPEQVHIDTDTISLSKEGSSIFSAVAIHDELITIGLADIDLAAKQPLAHPFFFDINNGLRPYREAFIKKLLSLPPDEGEKYWQTATEAMKTWERKNEIPESITHTYPPTLAEAVKYYTSINSSNEVTA